MDKPIQHAGRSEYRLDLRCENPREVVFAEAWKKENAIIPGRGDGRLELLLCSNGDGRVFGQLTQEEATAAATVVQWLGSPVGWNFLTTCIEACGYRLVSGEQAESSK